MNMRIFDLAAEYNFDAIRNHINAGNPINICDKDGSSLFAAFLNGYARYGDNAEEKEASASHDEHEVSNSFVSAKQKTPLIKRNNRAIVKQLDWFLANGADLNLCDLSRSETVDTPLSVAVCDEDYYLTEYLLEHGADPKVRLFSEHFPMQKHEDWLIEHMDVMMMDSKGEKFQNELRIAGILAKHGLDDFSGLCITTDKESRTIIGHKAQMKY